MKHFNPNTPKNIPQSSPLFTMQSNFSPFMSPFMCPLNVINSPEQARRAYNQEEDQEFMNFDLEKPQQRKNIPQETVVKYEDGEEEEIHDYNNNNSSSQQIPALENKNEPKSRVYKIIEVLVRHVDKTQQKLLDEKRKLISQEEEDMKQAFDILLKKFKRLKKTKQEMTKYCMRKAFKFLSQKIKKQHSNIKDSDAGLKYYFANYQNDQSFMIPFKKNSLQKTMNTNFLKKVFSSNIFLQDYITFLKYFPRLVEEDNCKKIKYLAQIIENHLAHRSIKKLENIKRLPWTQNILQKTQELAEKLTQHAPYQIKHDQKQKIDEPSHNEKSHYITQQARKTYILSPQSQQLSPPHIKQQFRK